MAFASRVLGLVIPTVVAATAVAEKPLVVWKNTVLRPAPGSQLAAVSKTLYLNDCMPNGCTVTPGFDNSRTNRSSIPDSTATLDAYAHGPNHWNTLVECVRDTFKPFGINVVTQDPGSAAHFEVMIGGTSRQLHPQLDAGGVAPFIGCGTTRDSIISFVFASSTSNIDFLCGAVAQEAGHVWGMDHAMDAADPMTYLELGNRKRFQNSNPVCGEFDPRGCQCGGSTQNSFEFMQDAFGLNPALGPVSVAIDSPSEGAWVRPNFAVRATLTSELDTLRGTLAVNGMPAGDATGELEFTAPTLPGGRHTIAVTAFDAGDRSQMASVTINQIAACGSGSSCASGYACLEGLCYPGADEAGGVGTNCTSNADCITGQCASDGTTGVCTATCSSGCPDGFDCITNVCWPSANTGGCASSGSGASGSVLWLVGIGAAIIVLRRRRT
jgi:hypothetical protein